jgi:hypothetical protein
VDQLGELHLIYTNDAHTADKPFYEMHFDVYHVGSTDGRTRWKRPTVVRQGYYGSMLSFIQLKGGRMVLPICYRTPRVWSNRGTGFDAYADMGRFSSGILYSDDGGDTWRQADREFKVPSPYIGADGMIEPTALQLKDGRVWLLIRTQLGRFFESFSHDGATWTPPRPSTILSSDSPPSLTRLKDGRIVMLWNNCLRFCYAQGGRHILHAAISDDDGRTWQGYREVACNPYVNAPPPPRGDHGVAYTLPALTGDGEIITPLEVGGGGGIYLLRFDPRWLCQNTRSCDFSSGLSDWSTFGTRGVACVADSNNPGGRAMSLCKTDPDWPAAAVWNFPNGRMGRLAIRLKINPGFAGARIGLTDHFSVPFDPEDSQYNLFNFCIEPEGRLLGQGQIARRKWHLLEFQWNCEKAYCSVLLDGRALDVLQMKRETQGVNYVRLCSTADTTDTSGLLLENVDAYVSH